MIALIAILIVAGALGAVLVMHERERTQWNRERQLLLNRIKPETAQYIPTAETPQPAPAAIGMDQDNDYWLDQGMSREDLAAAMMAQEIAGRPE